MKKIFGILLCFYLSSCLFGANESSKKIIKDFYLLGWDDRDWIAYSEEGNNLFEKDKIIVGHDVFA